MAPLPTRTLGRNGPEVTAEGFGAMGLSSFYGKPKSESEQMAMLDFVHATGVRFWDTADCYENNEDMLGKWFSRTGKRKDIFLSTKFSVIIKPEGNEIHNDPEYIKAACEASLKRLQTDYIDAFFCHRLNGQVPVETVVGAMAELVKEGKVRHIGLSEVSSETLRRACAVHPIAAVQNEYSPWSMDIEDPNIKVLETCRELGVSLVAYSPLGRGMLTGKIRTPDDFEDDDFRKNNPRFVGENFKKNLAVVDTLQAIAQKKGYTAGQLTLAWIMHQDPLVIPIPGTTREANLLENVKALEIKLTEAEDREIRDVVEKAQFQGDRYESDMMQVNFMDTPPLS